MVLIDLYGFNDFIMDLIDENIQTWSTIVDGVCYFYG